jgi:hypothetical protein
MAVFLRETTITGMIVCANSYVLADLKNYVARAPSLCGLRCQQVTSCVQTFLAVHLKQLFWRQIGWSSGAGHYNKTATGPIFADDV